jgi:hypothetical protein
LTPDKPIRLSTHAREQCTFRGAAEEEVATTIRTEPWIQAELGRLECRKDFEYRRTWKERFYSTKQVRPIFVNETDEIVVVTVYVYYF